MLVLNWLNLLIFTTYRYTIHKIYYSRFERTYLKNNLSRSCRKYVEFEIFSQFDCISKQNNLESASFNIQENYQLCKKPETCIFITSPMNIFKKKRTHKRRGILVKCT